MIKLDTTWLTRDNNLLFWSTQLLASFSLLFHLQCYAKAYTSDYFHRVVGKRWDTSKLRVLSVNAESGIWRYTSSFGTKLWDEIQHHKNNYD